MSSLKHKNSIVALAIVAALGLSGCGSSDSTDLPDPVPPAPAPTPDPVVPPDTGEALSFVIEGSVVDSASDLLIGDVTLSFRESGAPATNIADIDGNTFSSLVSSDGTFTFTAAEGATLGTLRIRAEVDGYVNEVSEFDLSGVTADTNILIELVSETSQGVAVAVQETTVADSTVAEEVVVEVDSDTSDTTAEVTVPAGTQLQDENGDPVDGTSVSIEVTVVDVEEDTAAESEEASAVDVIPAGLNDNATDNVEVPVGVANVEMVDDQGNQIENFSQPITITINVPADDVIAEGDIYNLQSYDEDTDEWTDEENDATIGAFDAATNSFPASFEIDHLTFFAITRSTPGCTNDIAVNFLGDPVPAAGLLVTMSSTDASASGYAAGGATSLTLVSADLALRYGVSAEATARVRVFDFGNNIWFDSGSEVAVCGTVDATLTEPVTYVSETLNVTATCTNDTTVSVPVVAAVTRYALPGLSATTAVNLGAGAYQLSDLVQGSTYNVTINPRFNDLNGPVPTQTTTIIADGTAETHNIPIACAGGTGAG